MVMLHARPVALYYTSPGDYRYEIVSNFENLNLLLGVEGVSIVRGCCTCCRPQDLPWEIDGGQQRRRCAEKRAFWCEIGFG